MIDMIFPATCHCGSNSSEHRFGEQRWLCSHCKRQMWMPIDYPPMGDNDVLVFCDGEIVIGCLSHGRWWIDQIRYEKHKPTHWMPLPEPPRHD